MKNTLSTCTVLILLTIGACKKDCIKSDRCNLEPDPGPCKAMFTKYYYDKKENKCKEFIWGGCDGVVPFNTKEECEKQCGCK